ncbi:MAG TPA: nitroreductase family deazaflavin-dependent oxidoreductase [Solirubrobacteraceae bacterium]|jgi:deazaflavin-dependent oxidoreductase (nitroreductase family)|nr:nitroreductase family deazaflavin-dependent oxidoreductase [Solirubrobacteraceae bacterium]
MDPLDWVERNWPLLGRMIGGHTAIYRASHGLVGHRFPGAPPTLLLDHVGARSAARRTSPLVYTVDGPNLVLVASKGGYPKNPGWFHNLMANPDTTVQVGSRHRDVHARVADPEERARLWPLVLRTYKGYADYQKRTEREIPLVILEPR